MSTIDVSQLLQDLSAANPCGDDLAYDEAFRELDEAATPKPEKRMGENVIPAQEPDWPAVKRRALELLRRSKDLRIAVTLSRSLLHTDGLAGLKDGLDLVAGLIERQWDGVYPRLEDGGDATMRVNTLASLSDWNTTVRPLRETPLVDSRALGRYSLRDIEIANGTAPKPAGEDSPAPDPETVDQAFRDSDLDQLEGTARDLRGALETVGRIASGVSGKTGASYAVNLERLTSILNSAAQIVAQRLVDRGAASGASGNNSPGDDTAVRPAARAGEIRSREDVIRLLDMACEYFKRNEPSSPVPLLLQRAKRLVSMDFLEIVQDLAPGGVAEVRTLGGLTPEA